MKKLKEVRNGEENIDDKNKKEKKKKATNGENMYGGEEIMARKEKMARGRGNKLHSE